ncbi:MAG: VWA domain-containing protein [Phycisphaeraceae bacterium]|nr:VWA domain-containing protein [Phycisphaeraceae bacterium]
MTTADARLVAGLAVAFTLGGATLAMAQTSGRAEPIEIVPQARRWLAPGANRAGLSAVDVKVSIDGQIATTTLELSVSNPTGMPQEAEVMLPVPDGVSIKSLQFDGVGAEPTAKLLPREEARRIYDSITRRRKDPALLEFAGYGMIRTSAFPIPANGTLKARITYDQLLTGDNGRIEYYLPRSEALGIAPGAVAGGGSLGSVTWTFACSINSEQPIATIYSPSHEMSVEKPSPKRAEVTVTAAAAAAPGPFRITYLPEAVKSDGLAATLLAYPDPSIGDGTGGFFLLLGALPARSDAAPAQKREITLVLDRSGSMQGEKFQQARDAAIAVIDGLGEGEFFNIVDYSDSVNSFEKAPVSKSLGSAQQAKAYLGALKPNGGTNIHDALLDAVHPAVVDGTLPMIIFLTDGLPTVGITSEVAIRDAIKAANTRDRRIFSFGVGYDVNTPLLSSISASSRGAPTFVLPGENIESKVSQVFRRLEGPRLASPVLTTDRSVREMLPSTMNDVFEGDQILVVGQYTSSAPLKLRLEGKDGGKDASFDLSFDVGQSASARNGYIPRLWATRKIGYLLGQIREHTASGVNASDPKMKELVDEVTRLSTLYGVMTEYTSFLATEPGVNFSSADGRRAIEDQAMLGFSARSSLRAGKAAVNQEMNRDDLMTAARPADAAFGGYLNQDMEKETVTRVQTFAQNTFYQRNTRADVQGQSRWVESRLLHSETEKPDQVVAFGTPEYELIAQRLIDLGQASYLAMPGEVLVLVDSKRVLLQNVFE